MAWTRLESGLVDEWFVPAFDQFGLAGVRVGVADVAEVVDVSEHGRQLGVRHWPAGITPGTGGETSVSQFLGQRLQRVVAGGIQREREADERRPLLVKFDGADLSAAGLGKAHVAVPERCAADAAAVLQLWAIL